jgi:hypothetical protein
LKIILAPLKIRELQCSAALVRLVLLPPEHPRVVKGRQVLLPVARSQEAKDQLALREVHLQVVSRDLS